MRGYSGVCVAVLLLLGACLVPSPTFGVVPGTDVTYTSDADFDQGTLLNVNHDAPNNNQLQLNKISKPLPFVCVACSGRGTVVRIDVNTGQILGEYLTAPDGMGRNPSRTTVDKFGNVWVANRDEYGWSVDDWKGSVTRIGLVIGGTRCDAGGNPDPNGQYLKPPFDYNTAVDRDGDGLIKTSRGLGNILPWTNAGGADTDGGVSTAEDECIINYTRTAGTGTRTVAVDANNDVWVGGFGDLDHEKIDGVTGQPVPGTKFNLGCGGYGGLIDKNGVLWSARGGTGLLRFVPNPSPPPPGWGVCLGFDRGDYGLGIDPNTGHIWHTFLEGNMVAEIAPDGTLLNIYSHGGWYAQGVAVDGSGNVWVAHSLVGYKTVGHLRTDGTYVGNVDLGADGFGPTGVAVDANGKIWVTCYDSNTAKRIDPSGGPIGGGGYPVGAVDLTVDLGSGATPYNYSDMTGFVAVGSTSPSGTWTVVQDGGAPGTQWGKITWNQEPQGSEPPGSSIVVQARTADNIPDLPGQPFQSVSSGVPFSLTGRYIEVRAWLQLGSAAQSPVLSDIRVQASLMNQPPDTSGAYADPGELQVWRFNSALLQPIEIQGVTDPDGDEVIIVVESIFQDEPVKAPGDYTAPDGMIVAPVAAASVGDGIMPTSAMVRAERNSRRNGRFYHIYFTAYDTAGNSSPGHVTVRVPLRSGVAPIDDGPLYDSTQVP